MTTTKLTIGKLSDSQRKAAQERAKLPDGQNLMFVVTHAGRGKRKGKEEGDLEFPTISMKVAPLEEDGDIETKRPNLSVFHSVDVPCAEIPEDKIQMVLGSCRTFLKILEVELDNKFPVWMKDDKKWADADGNFITPDAASALKNAANDEIAERISALYLALPEDAENLLDIKELGDHPLAQNVAFYATTKHNKEYVNVQSVRVSLDRDGKPVAYGKIK
jgi:hypothetical protein